jgi:hypothetical protein
VPFPPIERAYWVESAQLAGELYVAAVDSYSYGYPNSTTVVAVDVSDRDAPRVAWSFAVPDHVVGVALAGADLVVTVDTGHDTWRFIGEKVVHYTVTAAGVATARGELALPQAGNILAFDGRTAFIALPGALAIVDVSGAAPQLRHQLDLPQDPITGTFVADHLYIASNAGIAVVFPPCPPLP